jgi:hypothetical protein
MLGTGVGWGRETGWYPACSTGFCTGEMAGGFPTFARRSPIEAQPDKAGRHKADSSKRVVVRIIMMFAKGMPVFKKVETTLLALLFSVFF